MKPYISQLDDGSYQVVILHPDNTETGKPAGSTVFVFSDIEYVRRSEVNSHVQASIHIGEEIYDYQVRLNLSSASAREGFARTMGKIAQSKLPFDAYLSAAIVEVNKAILAIPRMTKLLDAPPKKHEQWLLEPFILDKAPNILFGEGGGGKTYVALRWMLSLATGIPFLGVKPLRVVPCMFLDYEDTSSEGNDRIQKLCGSKLLTTNGQTPDLETLYKNLNYFRADGVPLHDLVPILKEKIAEEKIEFILIDSAISACGGEPEKAECAARFFNAISKLNVTTLTIAHETKSENHDHVFGSIFWRNLTRNMWNAQSETDPTDNHKINFGLFHRKCNHASLRGNVPLRIFHGEGYVDVTRGNNEEWGGKSIPISERIVNVLKSGPKDFAFILESLQSDDPVKKETLSAVLRRLKIREILEQGNDGLWKIAK